MLDKDEIARRRALHPHDWSVLDSWARYVATQDLSVLRDEIATNPEPDVIRGLLQCAFGSRDVRVLELLERSGVSFHESDEPWSIESLLCRAIEEGHDCPEVICWLLDRGASTVRCAMNRWSPLHLAAIRNYCQVLTVLLDRGVPVDIGTEIDGDLTPLMEACSAGAAEAVALLLQRGADPARCDRMTSLSAAELARRAHHPEIAALIENQHRG